MRRLAAEILALTLVLLAACKNDDFHYPNVSTEMVELDTDSQGMFRTLRTDNQTEYGLGKDLVYGNTRPDSTYRARCIFESEDGITAVVYDLRMLTAPHPKLDEYFKNGIKTDPVKLISIWQSGGYINLHIGIMTKEECTHKVHFVKSEPRETVDGHQRVDLLLYHDQCTDFEAYTKDIFLSCPLSSLELVKGDSVYFSVQTYDGLKTYGFVQ